MGSGAARPAHGTALHYLPKPHMPHLATHQSSRPPQHSALGTGPRTCLAKQALVNAPPIPAFPAPPPHTSKTASRQPSPSPAQPRKKGHSMTLLYSGLAAPLKGKLLNCLPGIRWAPSDLPPHAADTDKEKKPHRAYSLFAHAKRPADSNTNLGPVYRRRSVVSVDEIPDDEIERRLKAQDQSRFFAMLPVEVRDMVYAYVFGADTLHLTMGTKRRFGHFVCEGPERHGESEGECGCRVLVGGREGRRVQGGGVLLVCRRMYSEAVPHLYTPHTFSLLHLTHLLYLPTRLPLPRINTIRTLRLRWGIRALPYLRRGPSKRLAYPEDTSNWARAWAILAGMQGLRDLYVVLVDPSRDMMWERNWKELEGFLLEPVKEVVRPWRFELVLPYASCGVGWNMGESPVRLRRPRPGPGEDED